MTTFTSGVNRGVPFRAFKFRDPEIANNPAARNALRANWLKNAEAMAPAVQAGIHLGRMDRTFAIHGIINGQVRKLEIALKATVVMTQIVAATTFVAVLFVEDKELILKAGLAASAFSGFCVALTYFAYRAKNNFSQIFLDTYNQDRFFVDDVVSQPTEQVPEPTSNT